MTTYGTLVSMHLQMLALYKRPSRKQYWIPSGSAYALQVDTDCMGRAILHTVMIESDSYYPCFTIEGLCFYLVHQPIVPLGVKWAVENCSASSKLTLPPPRSSFHATASEKPPMFLSSKFYSKSWKQSTRYSSSSRLVLPLGEYSGISNETS